MNKLTPEKRRQVIAVLTEGMGVNPASRVTGVSKNTILKLLADFGNVCDDLMHEKVRGLTCKRIQCDEIWAFVGAKQRQVDRGAQQYGDAWTWVAIDAETKLIVSFLIGSRDAGSAWEFMNDVAGRVTNKIQLTTDGLATYLDAVADNFGKDVDYGQLVKLYGDDPRIKNAPANVRYSPGVCTGCKPYARIGDPDPKHISTSFVERQNLTMRMSIRRFTRLTNGHSKKIENHCHAVAIHFAHYNFCRVHQTLRVTPAMEAGLADHVWELDELIAVLDNREQEAIEAGALKRGKYRPRNSN